MKSFDIIVIGGGIAGLGIADEASARGYSTLVLEAGSCCAQTSDNTLRIIHGGFRYLQSLDLPRVLQSLGDQAELLQELPHALSPLPCLMPLTRFGFKSRLPVACAGMLYRGLMQLRKSPLPAPQIVSRRDVEAQVPFLSGHVPHGALCWHDAVMVAPEVVRDHLLARCKERGVVIREHCAATSVVQSGRSLEVCDHRGDIWCAARVVNAMGPWLDTLSVSPHLRGPRPSWCKGINLIVSTQLDSRYALSIQSSDGRLFFCVPRGSGTAIGTWYEHHPANDLPPRVSEMEIERFLSAINNATGRGLIERKDIVGFDVGVLPVMSNTSKSPTPLTHERINVREGYVEVISTKYTTFRSQARKVLAACIKGHSA